MTEDEVLERLASGRWEKLSDEPGMVWFKKRCPALYSAVAEAEYFAGDDGAVVFDLLRLLGVQRERDHGRLQLVDALKKHKHQY